MYFSEGKRLWTGLSLTVMIAGEVCSEKFILQVSLAPSLSQRGARHRGLQLKAFSAGCQRRISSSGRLFGRDAAQTLSNIAAQVLCASLNHWPASALS